MMSMAGWIGLGFIWLVIACILAGIVTWTFHMREPLHFGWAKYDKDGTRHFGIIAVFVFLWFGIFAVGVMFVNAMRLIKMTAELFTWLDGWFV